MRYRIAAELAMPAAAPPLRRYRRFRTVNLISEYLVPQSRMSRRDGAYATLAERSVAAHERGVSITLVLDASSLAFAEQAADRMLALSIRHFRELAGWSVASCGATVTDADLHAALGPLTGHV